MSAGVANATTDVFLNSAARAADMIGAAKTVKSLEFQQDQQYLVTYRIFIQNMGTRELRTIRATDDLRTAFDRAEAFAVQRIDSSTLAVNPDFDGDEDENLLLGTDTLGPGAGGLIEFAVLVTIDRNTLYAENRVRVTAQTLSNSFIDDFSTDGLNPDPDGNDNPIDNDDHTPVNIGLPFLDATMTDNRGVQSFQPGDEIMYNVTLNNMGVGDATGVVFKVVPDERTVLINESVRPSRGTIIAGDEPGDTAIEVRMGTLRADGDATVRFRVRIPEGVLAVGTYTLSVQGEISSNNFQDIVTDDPRTEEPDDPIETAVEVVELPLQATMTDILPVSAADVGVQPGQLFTYTTVLTNAENATAKDVVVSITPDANTELLRQSLQTSQGDFLSGLNADDTQIVVEVGDIAASSAITISFAVRVLEGKFTRGEHTISSQGEVTSSNFLSAVTDDPDTSAENDATQTTVVVQRGGAENQLYLPLLIR
jgi:uncharacterized repeat protein (TIGR01451 family)